MAKRKSSPLRGILRSIRKARIKSIKEAGGKKSLRKKTEALADEFDQEGKK